MSIFYFPVPLMDLVIFLFFKALQENKKIKKLFSMFLFRYVQRFNQLKKYPWNFDFSKGIFRMLSGQQKDYGSLPWVIIKGGGLFLNNHLRFFNNFAASTAK